MRISDWSSDVCSSDLGEFGFGEDAVFDGAQHTADGDSVVDRRRLPLDRIPNPESQIPRPAPAAHHVLDHFHQAQLHAVVGVVDALDAVGFQLPALFGRDGAAAAADHADAPGTVLAVLFAHEIGRLEWGE